MNKNFIFVGIVAVVVAVIAFTSIDKVDPPAQPISTNTNEENIEQNTQKLAVDHHLDSAEAKISPDAFEVKMNALGMIPLDNESGAVGYGVITTEGTDAVVVSTSHAGVLDSETQKDASDPVWHNHVVKLGKVELCGEDPGVIDITFESPGHVDVDEGELVMVDLPTEFAGTHSLTKGKLGFKYGTSIQSVVEFKLNPKFNDSSELQAVCVTDIKEVSFNVI